MSDFESHLNNMLHIGLINNVDRNVLLKTHKAAIAQAVKDARKEALVDVVQGIDTMERHYTQTKERVVNPSYMLGVTDGINVCRTTVKCIIEGG